VKEGDGGSGFKVTSISPNGQRQGCALRVGSRRDALAQALMFDVHQPAEGSIEAPLTVLAELQRQGLVRHIGLSNVTPAQIAEGRRICEIVCTWSAISGR
jgi:diketogulonate reductase-like aldo/keto reductase